jgi:hypothetical protein
MKLRSDALYVLFGLGFIFAVAGFVWASLVLMNVADSNFGAGGRVVAGILSLLGFFFVLMRSFYRVAGLLDVRSRAEARERYRGIYRVLSLPASGNDKPNNWCTEDITVGDYGWESKPLTKDGRIWLLGLSVDWGHVWRAGFRPDEIEYVCPKPVSQFDWKDFEYDGPKPRACHHWGLAKPKKPCPFPVQKEIRNRRLRFPIVCA